MKEGDLRIWWIPQVPMTPFYVIVNSPSEAKKILGVLADYDIFQLDYCIKPDFSNAGGLEIFTNGNWEEWYDKETGEDIDEWDQKGRLAGQIRRRPERRRRL